MSSRCSSTRDSTLSPTIWIESTVGDLLAAREHPVRVEPADSTPISPRWRPRQELADRLHDEVVILLLGKAGNRYGADEADAADDDGEAAAMRRIFRCGGSHAVLERLVGRGELEPDSVGAPEHPPDQVFLALDPGRVVWDRPRSGEVEEPLATSLDVDGDGQLACSRLLGEEESELQGIVVGEAGEDEIPLLCLHPLPLLIEIRRHAPRMPPLDHGGKLASLGVPVGGETISNGLVAARLETSTRCLYVASARTLAWGDWPGPVAPAACAALALYLIAAAAARTWASASRPASGR